MNTSEIRYEGQLRTSCVHIKSNEVIFTDAPTDNKGRGEAFSPTDLVATALASCMLTIMGIKAEALKVNLDGTCATVQKVMTANPRRIAQVNIVITFPAGDWAASTQKSLELAAISCPVAKSLHSDIEQKVEFVYL